MTSVVVKGPDGLPLGTLHLQSPSSGVEPQLFDGWFFLNPRAPETIELNAGSWKSLTEFAGCQVRVLIRAVSTVVNQEPGDVNSALELQNFLIETMRAHSQRRIPLAEIGCSNGPMLLLPQSLSLKKQSRHEVNQNPRVT